MKVRCPGNSSSSSPWRLTPRTGPADGVKSLADQALKAGATKEEVMEAIRVTQYVSGVGAVYTAARAFNEIFKE